MPTFDPKNPATAWAAGLFEGEGCISIHPDAGVVITLSTTDADVLQRFVEILGGAGGAIRPRTMKSEKHRRLYSWSAYGRQVIPILEAFLPWLGERRSERAQEALERARSLRPKHGTETHCNRGHAYDRANTRRTASGARRCRTCNRENLRERRAAK